MTYRKIGIGIYQDASGITARVKRGSGRGQLTDQERWKCRFDELPAVQRAELLKEIRAWQDQAEAKLADLIARGVAARGTLDGDRLEYLATARLSPTCRKQRELQLTWWCNQKGDDGRRLGDRRRYALRAPELERVWNRAPSASASTKNKYRTAMFQLWTKLDGPDAPNPMRNLLPHQEPDALPRGLDYQVVRTILRHVPTKFGRKTRRMEARLRVFAYAPVTPAQIKLLEPGDLDLDGPHPSVLVRGRRKGKGAEPRRKPLFPEAVEALRLFVQVGAWGPFSTSSLRKTFIRARNAAEVELHQVDPTVDLSKVRLYDLRHSFGSLIFKATGSQSVTGDMLDHKHERTTRRYTLAEVQPHLKTANEAAARLLAALPPDPGAAPPIPAPKPARNLRRVK